MKAVHPYRTPPVTPPQDPHRVLVVDDEEGHLRAIARMLRPTPYEVCLTTSPREAEAQVRTEHVSVVIADQRMMEMTGTTLLKVVRRISPATTRLLVTAYADVPSVLEAINEGEVFYFLNKPLGAPDRVREVVDDAVQAHEERQEEAYAEQRLHWQVQEAEWMLTDAVAQAQIPVASVDVAGRVIQVSTGWSDLLGGQVDVGVMASDVFPEAIAESLDFCFSGGRLAPFTTTVGAVSMSVHVFRLSALPLRCVVALRPLIP